MTDLEDRLRDAFAAVDRQVETPPRRQLDRSATRRLPSTRVLMAVAAAVLAAVAGLGIALTRPGPEDVGVPATDLDPRTFDHRVVPICRYVHTHRPNPQFATADAYRVVAGSTLTLVADVRVKLAELPPPSDDRDLLRRVSDDLDGLEDRARNVLDVAELGRLDALASAWQPVNEYWKIVLGELAEHGAAACDA